MTLSSATIPSQKGPVNDGIKGYSEFSKASALLELQHQIVKCHIQEIRRVGVLPLCIDAVRVFYSHSRLNQL